MEAAATARPTEAAGTATRREAAVTEAVVAVTEAVVTVTEAGWEAVVLAMVAREEVARVARAKRRRRICTPLAPSQTAG